MRPFRHLLLPVLILIGCSANGDASGGNAAAGGTGDGAQAQAQGRPFQAEPVAQFNEPWAMTFLPRTPPRRSASETTRPVWTALPSPR